MFRQENILTKIRKLRFEALPCVNFTELDPFGLFKSKKKHQSET